MRSVMLLVVGAVLGIVLTLVMKSGGAVESKSGADGAVYAADKAAPKQWTEEDLLEIAKYYDQQADRAQDEAVEFEQKAASITIHEDPKGFRRSGLSIAAGMRWKEAGELRQLAAMHRLEAQRFATRGKKE